MEELINPSEVCHRAFELIAAKDYGAAEKLLLNCMGKTEDDVSIALFHSVLGVISKMRGEFKMAFRHYGRAEKLIPDDPAVKLIVANLLVDEFGEYESAIRRAKKVLELVPHNAVFQHQCYIIMGLAYVKQGKKEKVKQMLSESMMKDFEAFVTTKNIDFRLVEELVRREWYLGLCRIFLETALSFATRVKEREWVDTISEMLKRFPAEKAA